MLESSLRAPAFVCLPRPITYVLIVVGALATAPAGGQVRPVAIQEATVLTGSGAIIERGTVVFQNGKISAAGPQASPPLLARKIAARGKTVTPGLIDVSGTLALRYDPAVGRATARAADAFDRYAEHELRGALRQGVTTVYVPAWTTSGVGGLGAVVRLIPRGSPDDIVLNGEADLCAAIGADGREGPLARVKTSEDLRRRFRTAKEYREAWEDYEESLKEYEEKLAERAKKAEQQEPPKGGAAAEEPPKPAETDNEEKKEELKKPAEPAKDREADVLLRVLDGKLRLRLIVNHPADILNALELAAEFNIALVIEGAAGAHGVAQELAEHRIPVVVTGPVDSLGFTPGAGRYARADGPALLQQAGVDVYFGSGALGPTEVPNLASRVARAAGHGFDLDAGLSLLTGKAAALLGVEKEIGRLEPGRQADLVIWSAHPLSPGAVVERVFIAGREVFRSDKEDQGPEEE